MIVGFAGDGDDFLEAEEEADARKGGRNLREEAVVIAATAAEAVAGVIEGKAGDEDAIELRDGNARAAKRFRFAQAEGAADDDVIPTFDFVPIENRCVALLDHERQGDAFLLGPGFLDERMDVGFGREWSKEGDATALGEGGKVGGELADDEGGLSVAGGAKGAKLGAHFVAENFLGAIHLDF